MGTINELLEQLTVILTEYGVWGLIFVSFSDSSFFPVPPDVILIPLAIAQPSLALWYGVLTTATSVLGAVFGWVIGKTIGRPVLYKLFKEQHITKVERYFNRYGGAAIVIAAITPIPYKIFTIAAGVLKIPLHSLIIWSIIGRGLRFMSEVSLIVLLGPAAEAFIARYIGPGSFIIVGIGIFGYIVYRFIKVNKTTKFM